MTAANNDGVDFSVYDNDNNGVMDALYVIYAGYGEEEGGVRFPTEEWSALSLMHDIKLM